jgi:hypothetical protein
MADSTAQQPKSKTARRKAAVSVSQNVANRDQAAILFAEDEMQPQTQRRRTDQSIADAIGVSRQSITRWKRDPEFRAMIQDAKGKIIADALRLPSAQKHQRIRTLHNITDKLLQAIDMRAETYAQMAETPEEAARSVFGDGTPPWAGTGVFVAKKKISASGKVVTDWEPDTATIREIRANFEHIARETGQWEETVNVNHSGSIYHDERLDPLTVEQLEAIDRIMGDT